MERYIIPMETYGSSRSLSTKRAQRDINDLTHPMEDPIVEPGKLTVIIKLPYRKQQLTFHIQLGRYYPFHPPNIFVEYEHTYYKHYLGKNNAHISLSTRYSILYKSQRYDRHKAIPL